MYVCMYVSMNKYERCFYYKILNIEEFKLVCMRFIIIAHIVYIHVYTRLEYIIVNSKYIYCMYVNARSTNRGRNALCAIHDEALGVSLFIGSEWVRPRNGC